MAVRAVAVGLGLAVLAPAQPSPTGSVDQVPPRPPISLGVTTNQDQIIVRGPTQDRRLALVFTGHEFAEGADVILDRLAARGLLASFFLTGHFLAEPAFRPTVERLVRDGHYLGPHSDRHLLYCSWASPPELLVTRSEFEADLAANLEKIRPFGVPRPRFFLPPYEHANADIAAWTRAAGLVLVNYTSGTRSHADYTEERAKNFVSSQAILDSIIRREREDPKGLNGFLLLLHVGAGPGRADLFAARFSELLDFLQARSYTCVRIDALLNSAVTPIYP